MSQDATKSAPQVVCLDICPYGDMQIVLKTASVHATFVVSSHQLCTASPVFSAMLGPKSAFSEAVELRHRKAGKSTTATATTATTSSSNPYSEEPLFQLSVSDHDPTALAVVLYAMHARAQSIPESVSFEELLEIAYVCDYYDCAAAVHPWAKMWMTKWRSYAENPGYEDSLFLAWVFGDQDLFGALTKKFSRTGVVEEGEFMLLVKKQPRETKTFGMHIPHVLIDAMASERLNAYNEIFKICRDLYNRYDDGEVLNCVSQYQNCDRFVFGWLHKAFKELKISASEDDRVLSGPSIETMVHSIKAEIISLVARQTNEMTYNGVRHSSCTGFNTINQTLDTILAGIGPLSLTDFDASPAKKPVYWKNVLTTGNPGKGALGTKVKPEGKA